MRILVERGMLRCGHEGTVTNAASQRWVRVSGSSVLVLDDPTGRPIALCPNVGVHVAPCTATEAARAGWSTLVRIGGHPACLDALAGFTNGTPPHAVDYTVRDPGQALVTVTS